MQIQIHKQKSTQTLSKTQIQIHANANIEAKNIEEKNVCAKQHIATCQKKAISFYILGKCDCFRDDP